jgi:Flp pilus assembly pilin Flp
MSKIKKIFKSFIKDTSGSELIQWAIILAIAAGLAIVAFVISGKATNILNNASDVLDQIGSSQSST